MKNKKCLAQHTANQNNAHFASLIDRDYDKDYVRPIGHTIVCLQQVIQCVPRYYVGALLQLLRKVRTIEVIP